MPDEDIKHMATLEVELMVAQTALSEEKARLVNVRRQGEQIKHELQQLIKTCTDLNSELTAFCQNFNYKAENVKKRIKKEHPPHWNDKMVVNSIEEMRRKKAEIREEIETEISRLKVLFNKLFSVYVMKKSFRLWPNKAISDSKRSDNG